MKNQKLPKTICVRCGKVHKNVKIKKLTKPFDNYFYFAMCPTLNEPILIGIERSIVDITSVFDASPKHFIKILKFFK